MFDETESKQEKPEHKPGSKIVVSLDDFKHQGRSDSAVAAAGDKSTKSLDLTAPIYPQRAERQHLSRSLENAVKDGRLSEESKDKFEHCLRAVEARAGKSNLSDAEIKNVYVQAARLLDAKDGAVPARERAVLALQLVNHAAYPTRIDQGAHMTCNVTAVEELAFTKCPGRAMEVVAGAALHGSWKAPDGKTIRIDSGSLQPGVEESRSVAHGTPIDHLRSYASQIFQVMAVNDALQRRHPPEFYRNLPNRSDSMERVVDANGKLLLDNDGRYRKVPGLPIDEIQQVTTSITGDRRNLIHKRDADDPIDRNLVQVKDVSDLRSHLSRLDNQKDFPIIALMTSDARAFGRSGNAEAMPHVVCIIGYDQEKHQVRISNFWGARQDRWVDDALVFEGILK
jgi:hypothetical protein